MLRINSKRVPSTKNDPFWGSLLAYGKLIINIIPCDILGGIDRKLKIVYSNQLHFYGNVQNIVKEFLIIYRDFIGEGA